MLKLKPSCENCNKNLPPHSAEARICSYECTFCSKCVEYTLQNVCPNCGGGFVPRPVRPSIEWRDKTCLTYQPASSDVVYKPVDTDEHAEFARRVQAKAPESR